MSKTNSQTLDNLQCVAKVVRKSSISRLSKDSIFQFPFIVSDSIDTDEKHVLIKAAEKNYASLVVSVFSLYGDVELNKHKNVAKFLKSFHDNNASILAELTESATDTEVQECNQLDYSIIDSKDVTVMEHFADVMWSSTEDQIVMESLNDMYKPYDTVYNRLSCKLEEVKEARESSNGIYAEDKALDRDGKRILEQRPVLDSKGNIKYENGKVVYEVVPDSSSAPGIKKLLTDVSARKGNQGVIKQEKTDALAPTMVNISLIVRDANHKWVQDLLIGIKAMSRSIPSSLMKANMMEAIRNKPIFTFLAWTKGEAKIRDLFFNVSKYKADAIAISKEDRWLSALRRRAKDRSLYQALLKRNINPNSTIIITEQEALDIKEETGLDINDPKHARNIINKYFLLGFGVYSTESKVLDIMYDGDLGFSSYSLKTLIADNKKDTSLLAMNKY